MKECQENHYYSIAQYTKTHDNGKPNAKNNCRKYESALFWRKEPEKKKSAEGKSRGFSKVSRQLSSIVTTRDEFTYAINGMTNDVKAQEYSWNAFDGKQM